MVAAYRALESEHAVGFDQLAKQFSKQVKKEQTELVMNSNSEQLDLRDNWLGIRQPKQGYQPQPDYRKTITWDHIRCQ